MKVERGDRTPHLISTSVPTVAYGEVELTASEAAERSKDSRPRLKKILKRVFGKNLQDYFICLYYLQNGGKFV